MTISSLEPGRRFRAGSGKTGTLVYVSSMGAAVRWEGVKDREFTDSRRGVTVRFKQTGKVDHISAGTEVEAL